jgi:hypothetical protein
LYAGNHRSRAWDKLQNTHTEEENLCSAQNRYIQKRITALFTKQIQTYRRESLFYSQNKYKHKKIISALIKQIHTEGNLWLYSQNRYIQKRESLLYSQNRYIQKKRISALIKQTEEENLCSSNNKGISALLTKHTHRTRESLL